MYYVKRGGYSTTIAAYLHATEMAFSLVVLSNCFPPASTHSFFSCLSEGSPLLFVVHEHFKFFLSSCLVFRLSVQRKVRHSIYPLFRVERIEIQYYIREWSIRSVGKRGDLYAGLGRLPNP